MMETRETLISECEGLLEEIDTFRNWNPLCFCFVGRKGFGLVVRAQNGRKGQSSLPAYKGMSFRVWWKNYFIFIIACVC